MVVRLLDPCPEAFNRIGSGEDGSVGVVTSVRTVLPSVLAGAKRCLEDRFAAVQTGAVLRLTKRNVLLKMAIGAEKDEVLGVRGDFGQRGFASVAGPMLLVGSIPVMEVKGREASVVSAPLTGIAEASQQATSEFGVAHCVGYPPLGCHYTMSGLPIATQWHRPSPNDGLTVPSEGGTKCAF